MSTLFSYFKGQKSGVQEQPGTAVCDDAEPVSEPSHPSPHRKRVAPEICEKESVAPVPKKPHGAAETSPQRSSGEARSSLMSDEAGRKAERQRTLAVQNKAQSSWVDIAMLSMTPEGHIHIPPEVSSNFSAFERQFWNVKSKYVFFPNSSLFNLIQGPFVFFFSLSNISSSVDTQIQWSSSERVISSSCLTSTPTWRAESWG